MDVIAACQNASLRPKQILDHYDTKIVYHSVSSCRANSQSSFRLYWIAEFTVC